MITNTNGRITLTDDESQVKLFGCTECNCQRYLKTHSLVQKNAQDVKLLKCHECTFVSIYRSSLKNHKLLHKDESQVKMFKCDDCNFGSKHRDTLELHKLHKDAT